MASHIHGFLGRRFLDLNKNGRLVKTAKRSSIHKPARSSGSIKE
jgi:hypothetical protein